MAASKATLRGENTQYLYTRDGEDLTSKDYVMTSLNDDEDGEGGAFENIATAVESADLTAMEEGINSVDNTNKQGLTYNPITDQYGIRPDNYSKNRP